MVSRPQSPNQWYPAITDIASGSAARGRRTTNWSAASARRSTQPGAPAGSAVRQRASTSDSWATRRAHAAAPSSDGASSDESTTVTETPGASAIRRVPACRLSSTASSPRSASRARQYRRYHSCVGATAVPSASTANGRAPS